VECTRERWLLAALFAFVAQFMSYGATLVALKTPDRAGNLRNIVLGFDSLAPYWKAFLTSDPASDATRTG
jgi:galactose mutarotase-like enzyme